ncbi:leucine Rich repeat-containing domain protein, partial [Ancylostoma duodenale]
MDRPSGRRTLFVAYPAPICFVFLANEDIAIVGLSRRFEFLHLLILLLCKSSVRANGYCFKASGRVASRLPHRCIRAAASVIYVATLISGMLFLFLGLLTSETIACPSQCNCTEVTIDCSSRGLVAFPHDLPASTITLNLRGNNIGRISTDDVKGLQHLETLIISENNIRTIDENLLDFLPLLRRVSLARNKLRVIPSLAAQPSRLVSLDLRHNEISTVDVQAFSYLPHLIQLDLAHNRLQSLPQM